MVQRDTDLLTLVLEDVDVVDVAAGSKVAIAIGPHVNQQAHAIERQLRQRGLVLWRVDDALASATFGRADRTATTQVRTKRGKAVLEGDNLESIKRNLRCAAIAGRAQRTEIRREESPVVALGCKGNPLAPQRVEPQLRHLWATDCTRSGSGRQEARAELWS